MKIGHYKQFKYQGNITLIELKKAIATGEFKGDNVALQISSLRCSSSEEERSQIKKSLPAFTLSGDFGNDRKADFPLKSYTGLIQVDIDDVKDSHEIKRQVSKDPHVLLCFISPSGNGVKAIVRVSSDQEQHSDISQSFYNHLKSIIHEN